MISLFCPRDHYCENSKIIKIREMSGIRVTKVKSELPLHENSFDSSVDGEYIDLMKDDGSFGSGEENTQLVSQTYLDTGDTSAPLLNFKEISSAVAYKLIPMTSENTVVNMQTSPTHDTYFVSIPNPVEVYATTALAPKKPLKRDSGIQQSKAIITKKRDDKRRATHNEVERRRRDKINTWIGKLAALVPNSGLPDSSSKGGILAKACDYITELNEKQTRLEKLEEDNEKLVLEVLRLNQELAELRKENRSVRNQLADNCIVFTQRQKDPKS